MSQPTSGSSQQPQRTPLPSLPRKQDMARPTEASPPSAGSLTTRHLFGRAPDAQLARRGRAPSSPRSGMSSPSPQATPPRPRVPHKRRSPEPDDTDSEEEIYDGHERESANALELTIERGSSRLKPIVRRPLPSCSELVRSLGDPSTKRTSATSPPLGEGWVAAAWAEKMGLDDFMLPPPALEQQPRIFQGEIRHPLPTPPVWAEPSSVLSTSMMLLTVRGSATPPETQTEVPAPSQTLPAASAPEPLAPAPVAVAVASAAASSAASAASTSPPARATSKEPHAKTKNANKKADSLDGEDGEPNPNGPCVKCLENPTKPRDCRTAKNRQTGTKCNHCTRKKIKCKQPPNPDPEETEVEGTA
ncbi:hypothetical protein PG988_013617 [Apiospora saccharicola]